MGISLKQTCLLLESSLQAARNTRQLQSPLPKSYCSQRSPWKALSGAGLAGIPLLFWFFSAVFPPCCCAVSGSPCPPRSTLAPRCIHISFFPASLSCSFHYSSSFTPAGAQPPFTHHLKEGQLLQTPGWIESQQDSES